MILQGCRSLLPSLHHRPLGKTPSPSSPFVGCCSPRQSSGAAVCSTLPASLLQHFRPSTYPTERPYPEIQQELIKSSRFSKPRAAGLNFCFPIVCFYRLGWSFPLTHVISGKWGWGQLLCCQLHVSFWLPSLALSKKHSRFGLASEGLKPNLTRDTAFKHGLLRVSPAFPGVSFLSGSKCRAQDVCGPGGRLLAETVAQGGDGIDGAKHQVPKGNGAFHSSRLSSDPWKMRADSCYS